MAARRDIMRQVSSKIVVFYDGRRQIEENIL